MTVPGSFLQLWCELKAKGDLARSFADLEASYSASPRAYHTLDHVSWGLRRIDEIVRSEELDKSIDVNAVRWAMWFHDSVMTFGDGSDEDEERSGRRAYREAKEAGLPGPFCNTVLRLVLSTSHLADNLSTDETVLVDADLSILGASESDFSVYEARVRQEWAAVDDQAFARGRIDVIRRLLKKRRIFATNYARDKWEARAQSNLRRSMDKLKVQIQ